MNEELVNEELVNEELVNEVLEAILTNLKDAGCGIEEQKKAKQLYEAGRMDALIRHFRKCRCRRMEELHESQRKVDCLDFLIRRTEKSGMTAG